MPALAACAPFCFWRVPPPLAVLSKLQIPFQNLMPKQRGDPTVSLLELITCSSGHAAVAVRGGKLLLWKTVADGVKKTWSKLSGSSRTPSKEDNPPLALK